MSLRTSPEQRMSLRTSAHAGVAIRFPKPSPERGRWLEEPDEVAYNFLRIHERASRGGHWPPAFYVNFQRKWGCLKKTKCPNRRTVIANQWCSAQRIKIVMIASGNHTVIYRRLVWESPG